MSNMYRVISNNPETFVSNLYTEDEYRYIRLNCQSEKGGSFSVKFPAGEMSLRGVWEIAAHNSAQWWHMVAERPAETREAERVLLHIVCTDNLYINVPFQVIADSFLCPYYSFFHLISISIEDADRCRIAQVVGIPEDAPETGRWPRNTALRIQRLDLENACLKDVSDPAACGDMQEVVLKACGWSTPYCVFREIVTVDA